MCSITLPECQALNDARYKMQERKIGDARAKRGKGVVLRGLDVVQVIRIGMAEATDREALLKQAWYLRWVYSEPRDKSRVYERSRLKPGSEDGPKLAPMG